MPPFADFIPTSRARHASADPHKGGGGEAADRHISRVLRQRQVEGRSDMRRRSTLALLAVCAFCVAPGWIGTTASAGSAIPEHGRVDPSLAALAATSKPTAELRVIVQGSAARAAASAHGRASKDLSLIGGVTASVRAGDLERLAHDPRVSFVAPDAPVALNATDSVSAASLVTTYPGRASASNPWSAGAIGRGVGIAVIDSGVTPSPEFRVEARPGSTGRPERLARRHHRARNDGRRRRRGPQCRWEVHRDCAGRNGLRAQHQSPRRRAHQ